MAIKRGHQNPTEPVRSDRPPLPAGPRLRSDPNDSTKIKGIYDDNGNRLPWNYPGRAGLKRGV